MNPYGTRWRCKDKKQPAPDKGHVTPGFLRLDSTGEITSDSCLTDRYIPDMGTLIDSAFRKLHGTKGGFIDSSSASNVMPLNMNGDFLLNEFNQKQAMNSQSSPYSAPHWGCHKKTPTRPNFCAFPNFKNSTTNFYNPEFKHFQHQKSKFHPAMTGQHFGQNHPNKAPHKGHLDGQRHTRRPRYSFTSDKVPSDCSNWRNPTQDNILQDNKPIVQDSVKSTAEPLKRSGSTSQTMSHSKNVIDNEKTPKPVINIESAMQSQKESCEDLQLKTEKPDISTVPSTKGKELEGSNGQKSASVQIIDWFECDQSEEIGGSDVPQRIGFRLRTVSIDSESSNDSSVNNKTLQREASVLSDIFQPDDNVFHVTCMFKENDSIPAKKDSETTSEIQPNENQPCSKDDHSKNTVGVSDTVSPQSSNCAEKTSEPSDLDKEYKDCARRFVLLVRNNKKGCRPSAKKRRRSKARKDLSEIPSCQAEKNEQKTLSQEQMCKEKSTSQKSGATKNSGSANTVAFVVGLNSNSSPVSPLQQHSFLLSFDSESDDFSENSGDEFSDSDGVDELDFFSCPLQLNVFCPVKQPTATNTPKDTSPTNGCESDERQQEILDVNLKWSMNFSISPREKSKSKVSFAEDDKLCTVYNLDEEDRKGHWEEFVRDRQRFQRRITEMEEIMKPVLSMERRDRIYHEYFKTELNTDYDTDDD